MSQIIKVQKLQEGGTTPNVNKGKRLTFKVNDQLVDMYEQDLNAEFENYKSGLGKYGKNVGDWNNDYNHLINKISEGQASGNYFDFKVGDNSANAIKYGGESTNTERGLKDNGNTAKIGLLSGITGERNQGARNAALLDFLGGTVARSKKAFDAAEQTRFDDEQSKLKKEKDEADAKQKAIDTDGINDTIGQFNFNKNFLSQSLTGGDANEGDVETLFRTYHKDPKNQANLSRGYLQRLKNSALAGKLDSEDARMAFNNGRTLDLKDVTNSLRNMNLDDPKINYQAAFDSLGLGNEFRSLNDKSVYDKLLVSDQLELKRQNEALGLGTTDTATGTDTSKGATTAATGGDGSETVIESGEPKKIFDFSNSSWDNFRDVKGTWNGQEKTFGEWEDSFLDPNRKAHQKELDLYNSLYAPGGELATLRDQYTSTADDWIKTQDSELWQSKIGFFGGDKYNHNPYRGISKFYAGAAGAIKDVEAFRDITDNFNTGGAKRNHQYRVVQEREADPKNKYQGGIPKIKLKVLGPNGYISNAKVQAGKIPGSYNIVVPRANGVNDTYFLGNYDVDRKQGKSEVGFAGVNKYQFGGVIGKEAIKSTDVRNLTGGTHEVTDTDALEIGALLADITTLGATAFGPAGGTVAGIAGLASTAATARARSNRGEDWANWGLAADIGLDLASVIPIAGSLAKTSKIVRSVSRMAPRLKMLLGAGSLVGGSMATANALKGISEGDYSIENFSTLAKGLTGLVTGKRLTTDSKLAFKKADSSSHIKLNVKGDDVNLKLSGNQLESLDGKTLSEQKKIIKDIFNKGKDAKINAEDISIGTNKGFGLKGIKPTMSKEKSLDIKTIQGENVLRTEADYGDNPFIAKLRERAVKRQIMMNPELNAGGIDGEGRYNLKAKTYPGMNRTVEKIPEGRRLAETAGPDGTPAEMAKKPSIKSQTDYRSEFANVHEASNLKTGQARTLDKINEALTKVTLSKPKADSKPMKITISKDDTNLIGLDKSIEWKDAVKYKKEVAKETSETVQNIAKRVGKRTPRKKKAKSDIKTLETGGTLVPKFQNSGLLPKIKAPNIQNLGPMLGTLNKQRNSYLSGVINNFKPFDKDFYANNPTAIVDGRNTQGSYLGESASVSKPSTNPLMGRGASAVIAPTTSGSGISVNKNDLSEWARALANRRAHGMLDTRSSVALATAPVEVGMSIRGDVIGQAGYANAANKLRRAGNTPLSTDTGVNLAGRLASESKATDLELQGNIQNAGVLKQQEGQATQMAQQYAGVRADVANRNAQALAAKEQAERVGNNTRLTSMFKSIDNAWARQNAMGYQKEARTQGINDQLHMLDAQNTPIGGTSKYAGMTGIQASNELSTKYDKIVQTLSTTTDPRVRADLESQLKVIKDEMNLVQNDIKRKGLNTLKNSPRSGDMNLNFGNFNLGKGKPNVTSAFAKGGRLSMSDRRELENIKQDHKKELAWYKNYAKFIDNKANNDSNQAIASEKELSALIKRALGGK